MKNNILILLVSFCCLNSTVVKAKRKIYASVVGRHFKFDKSKEQSYTIPLYDDDISTLVKLNPKSEEAIRTSHLFSTWLDEKARYNHFWPKVPEYRVTYAEEYIYETLLDSEEISVLKNSKDKFNAFKNRFEKLKKEHGLLPIFTIKWDKQLNSFLGNKAVKGKTTTGDDPEKFWGIEKSRVQWPDVVITFDRFPKSLKIFREIIYKKLNSVYRVRTRKRTLDLLLHQNNLNIFRGFSKIEIDQFYLNHLDDYTEQLAEFFVYEIQIETKSQLLQSEISNKFFEISKKFQEGVMQEILEDELTRSEIRLVRQKVFLDIIKNFAKSLSQEELNVVKIAAKKIPWSNIHDHNDGSIHYHFALNAPLGTVLLPNANYLDKDGNFHILTLVSESLKKGDVIPVSDPMVKKDIETKIIEKRYLQAVRSILDMMFLDVRFNEVYFPHVNTNDWISKFYLGGMQNIYTTFNFLVDEEDSSIKPLEKEQVPESFVSKEQKTDIIYRLPEMYNSNPLAGRLYVQPIGPYEHQVVEDLTVDINYGTASEYNRWFHDGTNGTGRINRDIGIDDENILKLNSYYWQVRIAKGMRIKGLKIEFGGNLRVHQDNKDSGMEAFLLTFHDYFSSEGHIAPDGQPFRGMIGENKTVIIGDDGQVYITSAEVYTKLQILSKGDFELIDNLSTKFSVRIPMNGDQFNNFGVALSVGLSKEINRYLTFVAAGSVGYQDLSASDFNSTNLEVENFVNDLYAGIIVDPWSAGGFYASLGLRYSNKRAWYKSNPDSSRFANVIHLQLNYQTKKRVTYYFALAEEIPSMDGALEADFAAIIGMSWSFGPRSNIPKEWSIPFHE